MRIKNISEAKAQLSSLIDEVENGAEIIIARAGRPVVRLVPFLRTSEPRRPGALKGKIQIAQDFDVYSHEISELFEQK